MNRDNRLFCGCSLAVNSSVSVGLMVCVLCVCVRARACVLSGSPEGSTGSGSGFKTHHRRGLVSSDRLVEPIEFGSPGYKANDLFTTSNADCRIAPLLYHTFLSRYMCFPTMWYFDKCRLRQACTASF